MHLSRIGTIESIAGFCDYGKTHLPTLIFICSAIFLHLLGFDQTHFAL